MIENHAPKNTELEGQKISNGKLSQDFSKLNSVLTSFLKANTEITWQSGNRGN